MSRMNAIEALHLSEWKWKSKTAWTRTWLAAAALALLFVGCSDSTTPVNADTKLARDARVDGPTTGRDFVIPEARVDTVTTVKIDQDIAKDARVPDGPASDAAVDAPASDGARDAASDAPTGDAAVDAPASDAAIDAPMSDTAVDAPAPG